MDAINVQSQVNMATQLASAQGVTSNVAANGDFFAAFLQSLTKGSSDNDMLMLMSGFLNSKNGETDKDVSVQEMAAMLNSSFGTSFDLASIVGGEMNTLESVLGNIAPTNGLTSDVSSSSMFESLLGGNNQNSDSIFGSNQSTSNENNILNQMMTLNSARQMVDGGAFDHVSQRDTMAAVTAMMQGDISKVNTIITADQNSIQNLTNASENYQTQTAATLAETPTQSEQGEAIPVQVVSSDTSAKSSGEEMYNGDMNFKSSVFQAQQLMKNQKATNDEVPVSYDMAAQSAASTLPVANVETQGVAVTAPTAVDLDDLTDKIDAGIRTGDFTTSKEFAVKLRPEGLGDVTIKVVKEQNQIIMSIVTASSEAAKLLNDQLPSLRQSLNAMNVSVNEVVAQQANEQTAYEQQSFTNFNGQQQHSFSQAPSTSYSSFDGEEDAAQLNEVRYVDSEHMKVYA